MTARTALIAGATGLVGSHLLDALLDDPAFERVVAVGRRASERAHPKLSNAVVDFARLDAAALPEATDAFCALGTTIKKAGSREAFRAVDFDAVVAFAKAAQARGARRFYVVTALGADPRSLVFYNRVKGEVEEALRALGFDSLVIARPSLLLGERGEKRLGERLAISVTSALAPLLKHLDGRPIEGNTVALALRALAHAPPAGARVVPSHELHALAARGG